MALKEKELETKLLDSQLQEVELEARASERAAGKMKRWIDVWWEGRKKKYTSLI